MLALAVTAATVSAPGLAAADTLPLPVRVEGRGVTVRAQADMDALAREVAARAPAALARLNEDLAGLPRPERVEIRLVRATEDLQAVAPPGARVPDWAAGVAFPRAGVVAVATRRGPHSIDVHSTVTHELAHMALGAALGGRAPRWLDEGFAYLHSSDFSWARTRTLTGMAWSGDHYFLFELENSFPPGEHQAGRAYAQAYDFVAYLAQRGLYADPADDGNRLPFRQFLAAIADGKSTRAAAVDAYGLPLEHLEAEWWEKLRQRYMWSFVGLFTIAVWAFGGLLLVIAWLRRRSQNRRRLAAWAREEAGLADDALH